MKSAIADGLSVTLHYRLTLDDGTVADDSFDGEPLVYVHGAGRIVPGLERRLTGMKVGDEHELVVEAADGYGEYDPTAEQSVPRAQFPPGAKLEPGVSFQAEGPNGVVSVWVRKVDGDDVIITSNHPLAGQRLNFKVRVVDVREASAAKQPAADSG